MSKKTVTEQMSLVPPIGGVGTAITPTQSSTLGVGNKKSQTATLTQNLVKRINDVTAAKKVNQQQLLQLVNQLKQSIAQDESNEETAKRKLAKEGINIKPSTIGRVGGSIIGGLAGGAVGVPGGPVGALAARAVGAEIGSKVGEKIANAIAPGEDDEKKSKKNKHRKLNNKKDTFMAKNKSNIQEGLGGSILGGIAGAAIPGAPILGAIGGSLLGSKVEDKALSQNEQSDVQSEAISALERKGYKVTRSYHEDHGKVVLLTKKPNRYTTVIAEVDPDGTINGQSLAQFLNEVEENEEQTLSKAQQKIAGAAAPHDKITGADFAALKAKKSVQNEAVTTTNFLKAISQKNYAQADKYLGSLVNEKLKRIISRASK